MTEPSSGQRTVRIPADKEIRRLETYVRRMEQRYECSSQAAATAVQAGRMKETAELSRWLASYDALMRLVEATGSGAETGSPTKATA